MYDEWVSQEAGKVQYVGKIKLFRDGMYKWRPGISEATSTFNFMDSAFKLAIKTCDQNGFVSLFLINENDYDIFVNFDLEIGNNKQTFRNKKIAAGKYAGKKNFYQHHNREDPEYEDTDPEIFCTITNLWKGLKGGNSPENHYQLTKELEELEELKELGTDQKSEIERLHEKMDQICNDVCGIETDITYIKEEQREMKEDQEWRIKRIESNVHDIDDKLSAVIWGQNEMKEELRKFTQTFGNSIQMLAGKKNNIV